MSEILTIETPLNFRMNFGFVDILLVGCGGIGSFVAQTLAQLVWHSQISCRVAIADGDHVEPKNVGRQAFVPVDCGKNKAQITTARINAQFGFQWLAMPTMLDDEGLEHWERLTPTPELCHAPHYRVIVGAVDTTNARRTIAEYVNTHDMTVWIDAGNNYRDGQVVLGTTRRIERLSDARRNILHLVHDLPLPSVVLPSLLIEEETTVPIADCATAVTTNQQHLCISRMMADCVMSYLYALLIARDLDHYMTILNVETLTMTSYTITHQYLDTMIERI